MAELEVRAKVSGVAGQRPQGAPRRGPDPRQGRRSGARHAELLGQARGAPDREAAAIRARQRRAEERAREGRHRRRQPRRAHDPRRRGSESVADLAARAGSRVLGSEAFAPRHRGARPSARSKRGTESPSVRFPTRHPLWVAVELVLGAALRAAAPRGREDPPLHQEEAVPRGHLEGRHRTHRREGRDQHPHRAAGHPDRQARRRGRRAPQGTRDATRRARSSSTSRRSARRNSTPSSSRRTSRCSSSAASPSGAR